MIPKKVHMSWKTKDIADYDSPLVREGVRKLIDLNPSWEVKIHDDEEVDAFLKQTLSLEDYRLLADKGIVEKLDVWRLAKMYLEGGVYVDVDRLCNTPLDELCKDGVKCVLPTCRSFDFSQDFMMSEPGNPIFKATLDLNLHRRRQGHSNIYLLGAQTYLHAISMLLTGEMVNTDPGEEEFAKLTSAIERMPFIETYKEDPPYNTVLFRNGSVDFDHEQEKRRLYAGFNMRHWSGDW